MRTLAIVLLTFTFSIALQAQDKEKFRSMGAKAKAKMAKQEEKEAEADDAYLQLMTEGQSHFEANEFEEAIDAFERAQERRPLNVYPPVMIEDVKLAMENYEPENEMAEKEDSRSEPEPQEEKSQDERVEEAYEKEMEKVEADIPPPPEFEEPEVSEEPDEVKRDAEGIILYDEEDDPEIIAKEYPDGLTEEEYKEGSKTILKRVKVANGEATVYKKVTHQWGGVFYFKDGESITLRTWEEETGKSK